MSTFRPLIGLALLATGACYAQDQTYGQSTMPEPVQVSGPPGGAMDPGYGYQQTQDPGSYGMDPNATTEPSQDPQAMAAVSDTEIDTTLDGYGEWVDGGDYGQVWRPYNTVVGADFTPYETCGTWAWTTVGWSYNCDYSWGWLPFHYGRWGWFDGYWGWQRGYEWGPAWVDWRNGGGYVGWRPQGPEVRDHRHGPEFHDHRHGLGDSQWRFATEGDFMRPHIRAHEFKDPAQALAVTAPVNRLPIHGTVTPVHVATVMQGRPGLQVGGGSFGRTGPAGVRSGPAQPTTIRQPPSWQANQVNRPAQQWRQPDMSRQPTWQQQPAVRQPAQTWRPPAQQPTWRAPAQQSTWRAPAQTYRPPVQTYHPPAQTYSAPSHSYSAPSHSYSAPSHSSGGGGGGHSFGGGGHHR